MMNVCEVNIPYKTEDACKKRNMYSNNVLKTNKQWT